MPLPHPLVGIYEKLHRANESIQKLDSEIALFFKESKYPIIPAIDDENFLEAINYHADIREVPIRFSILAGEIIHQMRSCLDHLVWQLSSEAYRRTSKHFIEFPVFKSEPLTEKKIASYEGKIKGISSTTARDAIGRVQPYKSADPLDHPLWIIHHMDIIDKHQELVMVFSTFDLHLPPELLEYVVLHTQGKLPRGTVTPHIAAELKQKSKFTPNIAFREFGKREKQPVVPGLFQLTKYVKDFILGFSDEFHFAP